MSTPDEPDKLSRFIHEIIHEISDDKEVKESCRDFIAMIIEKWEGYKAEYFEKFEKKK